MNTSTSGISPDVAELKDMVKALLLDKKSQNQAPFTVKAVEESYVTCGGAHSYRNCLATNGNVDHDNIQEFVSQASTVKYNKGITRYRPLMIAFTLSSGTLPSNTITNPRSDLKAITTQSGVSYDGPQILPPLSFLPTVVGNEPEGTKDTVTPPNNGSKQTLHIGKKAITFNLEQTSRYSANYNDITAKRIEVIDMACEEYSKEVLSFSDVISSGNPTPYYDPIVPTTFLTLTPFENSDFLLEEVDAFFLSKMILLHQSPWVSPAHCVPKKGSFTVVETEENELILTRLVMGWRVCIDYHKLNEATRKDHFLLPFMDKMLERLVGNQYCCFLDGFSGYIQIPIDLKVQEKTIFTAHTERLLNAACLLGYAMHRARFK
nr:reverse transcriptase domain-containing protein [Tanacetum cinerariifolium]